MDKPGSWLGNLIDACVDGFPSMLVSSNGLDAGKKLMDEQAGIVGGHRPIYLRSRRRMRRHQPSSKRLACRTLEL